LQPSVDRIMTSHVCSATQFSGASQMGFTNGQSACGGPRSPGSLQVTDLGGDVRDDHTLFTRVVVPHLDDAYNLAYWLTGNRADAEDAVQDAALRALRAINSYAGGNARAWMLSIVRNASYSLLRKNRPNAVVAVEDLEAAEIECAKPYGPDDRTPESALIARTDAETLRAAIAALPTPFRETLVLREINGLDYREIAKITEVPIGTVMSRLARARGRLIAIVNGEGISKSRAPMHRRSVGAPSTPRADN
jgi:RNA polymerase sigma factor (sigma-70 family)